MSLIGRIGFVIFLVSMMIGCQPRTASSKRPGTMHPKVLATAESPDDSVRAKMELQPHELRLADTPRLIIEIDYAPEIVLLPIVFGESFGDFRILEINESEPQADVERFYKKIVLKLIPQNPGENRFVPVPVNYCETSSDTQSESPEIRTITLEADPVRVRSEISPEDANLNDFAISEELLPMRERPNFYILTVTVLVVLLTICMIFLFGRHRPVKQEAPIVRYTPKMLALMRLDELMASRLDETDIKQFYERLSGIVRWYIEETTVFKAKELTTEEFLREITRDTKRSWSFDSSHSERPKNAFGKTSQEKLARFLEASDLVKFAKFRPPHEEIAESFLMAKEFIETDNRAN